MNPPTSDHLLPPSTRLARLAARLGLPWLVRNPRFTRASTDPTLGLVTERIDLKDAPQVFNYSHYPITPTTTGGRSVDRQPRPTPEEIIPHHSSTPSTAFDDLDRDNQ